MHTNLGIVLPAFWAAIAQLQVLVSKARRAAPSSGEAFDEALTCLLDDSGGEHQPAKEVQRRFRSLSRNRAQKHRARRHLLVKKPHVFALSPSPNPALQAERNELVVMTRDMVSADEWELLQEVAHDRSFSELAEHHRLSVPALKSRIFRIRERIRISSVGSKILRALTA
jgi:hypothetical protein